MWHDGPSTAGSPTAVRQIGADVDPRTCFLHALDAAFTEVGVDYAVLHGFDPGLATDSDVDVVVSRASLDVVDVLVRIGTLGRLLQQFHYDVPWCRYYVLEAPETDRRYRQLDVACDPWGIGCYGAAVGSALRSAVRLGGVRVPRPPAQVVYLAAKRARKRLRGPEDHRALLRAFRQDPDGASAALENHFGAAGKLLAAGLAVGGDDDVARALRQIDEEIRRQRRRPHTICRRLAFSCARVTRRCARPTGLAVSLAGPDGTGKSTLAGGLEAAADGLFRRVERLHLGPQLLPPPASLLGRPIVTDQPHTRQPSGRVGSMARLGYLWLDTVAGWPSKVALPRIRSTLVILERGWSDLLVDSRRYRLRTSPGLVRLMGGALPRPDLVLVLRAPSGAIHRRKPELPITELERQMLAWERLASAAPGRHEMIETSGPTEDTLDTALAHIDNHLAVRQGELESCALALRCLGGPAHVGTSYTVVTRRGQPRWVLRAGLGARGPHGAGVYRPATAWHVPATLALEGMHRVGVRTGAVRVRVQPENGIAPLVAEAIGVDQVELAAAVTGGRHRGERALLSARRDGRLLAYVKVARGLGGALVHEHRLLQSLAGASLRVITVPEVIGYFEWDGCDVLVVRPIPTNGWSTRPLSTVELDGLVELAGLNAGMLGTTAAEGEIPVHGDFAPWNCSIIGSSRLALWDWEDARLGLPLEDLFHWQVQRMVLLEQGSPEGLVADALDLGGAVGRLCRRLDIAADLPARSLEAYLKRSLAELPEETFDPAVRLRRRALTLLQGGR